MAGKWPKIRSREVSKVSPWMSIMAREVEFARGAEPQVYHAVEQADYVSIVAVTPDGRFPLVRQYRPALEDYTWELPCGTVDPGEDAAETCRRELLEETGFTTQAIRRLGNGSPCTGPAQQPHPRVLRRDRRAGRRTGARHHAAAGHGTRTGAHDPRRRVRVAASHRLADAGRALRPDRAAAPCAAQAFGVAKRAAPRSKARAK